MKNKIYLSKIMNYDKILIKICFGQRLRFKKVQKIINLCPNIKNYLLNRFDYIESIKESLHRIKNNIEIRPICPICGKPVKFMGLSNMLYRTYCSDKCAALDPVSKENRKQTCIRKYGVEYSGQAKEKKEKTIKTWLNKYGVDNPRKAECIKKKITQYFKDKNKVNKIIEKRKQTCLEKYGVEYSLQSDLVKNKIKETCLKKYGVDHPWKSDKVKQEIKETIENRYGDNKNQIIEKIKETCLKKYGVSSWSKTNDFKQMLKENREKIENKKNDTKRKNHTFNSSKIEEELYLYIKEKFPSVKRQYKDNERYPWCCDFYIQELDYFIELNGSWTHGNHPFNSLSKEDQDRLKEMKTKAVNSKYYNNAIKNWTERDVNKRNKAKENNLNFKEVWSLKEGKEFIDKLYEKIK